MPDDIKDFLKQQQDPFKLMYSVDAPNGTDQSEETAPSEETEIFE